MTVDLAHIRMLEAEATPAPWQACAHVKDQDLGCPCGFYGDVWDSTGEFVLLSGGTFGEMAPPTTTQAQALDNLRFIVAMRAAILPLCDELEKLRLQADSAVSVARRAVVMVAASRSVAEAEGRVRGLLAEREKR